jgi:hypothetical protein
MAFELVAFVHVSDELPHVGGQQLVLSVNMWAWLQILALISSKFRDKVCVRVHGYGRTIVDNTAVLTEE